MVYRSFQEWKQDGYIVKKGEHATKVDDDYKNTYLFSEEQVVPISKESFIDSIDKSVWAELAKERYPKIKKVLKENLNIDTEDENGNCKSFYDVLSELSIKFKKLNVK